MDLPPYNSFNSILVVVDRLTKMFHFIFCNKMIIGEKITKLFLDHVFSYHSFPQDIIYDHEPQFASKFWR
jgi:glycosylphosphatidylinositol phospholipase D